MAMLLAVVLLYVGAVLGVNGIWLIGQARAARVEPIPAGAGGDVESVPAGAAAVGGGAESTPPGAPPVGGADSASAPAKRSPILLEGREVAVINIFTGFVGLVI